MLPPPQSRQNIPAPKCFLLLTCSPSLSPVPTQATANLVSVVIILPFLEFHINGVVQYVVLCLLVSLMFLIFVHVATYILFMAE